MNAKRVSGKHLFVLDTNILMHDPTALFRFKEHDIFLPMIVIEELDNHKKGNSEVSRNARQSSRFLDELMQDATPKDIESGLSLNPSSLTLTNGFIGTGRLFFQTTHMLHKLPDTLPGNKADNDILGTTRRAGAKRSTVLVESERHAWE